MRTVLIVLLLLVCWPVQAQTTDWSVIEQLPHGTKVVLITRHMSPCMVEGATQEGLACAHDGVTWWVDRTGIRRILLPSDNWTVIGTLVGAATGGTIAGLADHNPETAGKPLRVAVATAVGGCVGFFVGRHLDATKARVIYERP